MNGLDPILSTFDLDTTDVMMIVVCAGLFYLLWTLLEKYLFAPYVRFYEVRESKTTGARTSLEQKARELEDLETEYRRRLTDARVAAVTAKLQKVGAAKKSAATTVDAAESDAKSELERARAELRQTVETLRAQALSDASSMADAVVQKIKAQPGAGA